MYLLLDVIEEVLFSGLGTVLFLGVVVYGISLNSRLKRVEADLAQMKKGKVVAAPVMPPLYKTIPTGPVPVATTESSDGAIAPVTRPVPAQNVSANKGGFIAWLREDFLMKVGAFLLILAIAWFVSYAFANEWIGPVGQIMLGLCLGALVLIFGTARINRYASQGAILVVLGAGIVLVTVTAGQYVYEMFQPTIALLLIFVTAIYVAFVAIQYERSSLAYAGLVTALLAPFLVNSNTDSPVLFMLYLLAVVVGTLWVVWRLRAEGITLVALGGVVVYTIVTYDLDQGVALLFSFVFTGIFFITNIVSLIRRYTEWVSPAHVITALVTGGYIISAIVSSAPEEWMSTYLIMWALVFVYGSHQVYLRTLNRTPFYIYAGVGLILIGIATALEFSGAWLTIMFTGEVLAAVLLLGAVTRDQRMHNIATALFAVPGLLSVQHFEKFSYYTTTEIPWSDFWALSVFAIALVVAGMARLHTSARTNSSGTSQTLASVLFVLASLYAAAIIWLSLHIVFSETFATMVCHVLFSVTGLVLYRVGQIKSDSGLRMVGKIVLGLVVARLLFIDVWSLDMVGRISTFLVVGLLFMATALTSKLKAQTEENNNQN